MTSEPAWIEHDGSAVCPVPAGHDVEVKFRDGMTERDEEPEDWLWNHEGGLWEVTHYRDWTAWEQQQASKDDVPEWAQERVREIMGAPCHGGGLTFMAFARYIAAHEQVSKIDAYPMWRQTNSGWHDAFTGDPIILDGDGKPIGRAEFRGVTSNAPSVEQQASKDGAPEWARRAKIEADGLRYRINNPSAWEAYSEEGSEQLRHAVNVLDDILAAHEQELVDPLREVVGETLHHLSRFPSQADIDTATRELRARLPGIDELARAVTVDPTPRKRDDMEN